MAEQQSRTYNIRLHSQKGEQALPTVSVLADAVDDTNMGKSGGRVKFTLGERTVASFDSKRVAGWWIDSKQDELSTNDAEKPNDSTLPVFVSSPSLSEAEAKPDGPTD